jgi:hypothetical protein
MALDEGSDVFPQIYGGKWKLFCNKATARLLFTWSLRWRTLVSIAFILTKP